MFFPSIRFNNLDYEDFSVIAKISHNRSVVSGKPSKLKFVVFNPEEEINKHNIVLITKSEAFHHIKIKTKVELIKLYTKELVEEIIEKMKEFKIPEKENEKEVKEKLEAKKRKIRSEKKEYVNSVNKSRKKEEAVEDININF